MEKFKIEGILGQGAYGIVYRIKSQSKELALKVQKSKLCSIKEEINVLKALCHPQIPEVLDFGVVDSAIHYLVMPLFKANLFELRKTSPEFFTRETLVKIGISLISVMEYLHEQGFIHRDIKPENLMLGYDSKIHLIDFGSATKYTRLSCHYSKKSNQIFVGTPMYSSINAQNRVSCSRRDDMESLGYTLLFLLEGDVPWSDLPEENYALSKQSFIFIEDNVIMNTIRINSPSMNVQHSSLSQFEENLFDSRRNFTDNLIEYEGLKYNFRDCLRNYLSIVIRLEYTEIPDYVGLMSLLRGILIIRKNRAYQSTKCSLCSFTSHLFCCCR
jgi:serine/threonine protein kinase